MIFISFLESISTIATYIGVAGVLLGIIIKVYMDIAYKTVRKIGKAKIMEIILLVNELTSDITLEDLVELLTQFKKKRCLELDMKSSMMEMTNIFDIQKALHAPKVSKEIEEYKRKKEYGVIKNKKRWNELVNDMQVQKALDGIIDTLITRYEIQAQASNKKVPIDQVTNLINIIKSDSNLKKNRETRKKLETYNITLRTQEKEIDLKKIQQKLFEIFKRKEDVDSPKH